MKILLSRLLVAGLIVGGSLAVSGLSNGGSFRLTWTDEATVAEIRKLESLVGVNERKR